MENDPLAKARLRGLQIRNLILAAEGGTLSTKEAAKFLGVTRNVVNRRRRRGQLLGLPTGPRQWHVYPVWQFGLAGFEEVMANLSTRDPWTRVVFFLAENTYLDGRKPLDVLRAGNVHAVRRAAWALGQHGA